MWFSRGDVALRGTQDKPHQGRTRDGKSSLSEIMRDD